MNNIKCAKSMIGDFMKKERYVGICTVGEKGQIVIPKQAREMFNIKAGDSIITVCDKEKGIVLIKSDILENNISFFTQGTISNENEGER